MVDTIKDGKLNIGLPAVSGGINIQRAAEMGIVTRVHEAPQPYSGDVVITPSEEEQVLQTIHHTLLSNITINPIPSNYGLITWDGTTLTVS